LLTFFSVGGILTVADDLLKNDGKKFIEMMEHLAERRVQREQDATYSGSGHSRHYAGHHNGHTHSAAPPEEDEYEDEDEEDYNSEEYEEEEDEMVIVSDFQLLRTLLNAARQLLRKISEWKKAEECFRSSQLVCLNRGC
jgi:hypothetical protein